MKKALFIFSAIILGSIFTFGHQYTFLIRYNLMVMLFFAFLSIPFNWSIFQKNHYIILVINILIPLILYTLLQPFHLTIAQVVFVLTVVPTAAAGPVIAEIMKANILVTTGSVILTTPIIALLLPFFLSSLLGISGDIPILELIVPIMSIVFIPLLISQGALKFAPKWSTQLRKVSFVSFPLFLTNIFIACGNASYFVQENLDKVKDELLIIIGLTALICIGQFRIGRFIGRTQNTLAYELAMGRKNTMIGLWLALTYFSPIIALGPICYIVCHNIYNSFQLWQMERVVKEG